MKRKAGWLALMLAGYILVGWAQPETPSAPPSEPVQTGEKYTLRRTFKAVEIERFKLTTNTNGEFMIGQAEQGMPLNVTSTTVYRFKTAGIKPDGTATVIINVEKMTASQSGMEMSAEDMGLNLSNLYITTRMNDRMQALDTKVSNGNPAMMAMLSGNFMGSPLGSSVILPEQPVAIGDSWEVETPNPFANLLSGMAKEFNLPPVKTKYTLLGIEKVNGQDAYKIQEEQDSTILLDADALKKLDPQGEAGSIPAGANLSIKTKGTTFHYLQKETCRTLKVEGQMEASIKANLGKPEGEDAPNAPFNEFQMQASVKTEITPLPVLKTSTTKPPAAPSKPGTTKKPAPKRGR